mgnify:CR=1 FL=1
MKTIKHIAGDILLYFYALQRKNGFSVSKIIDFEGIHSGSMQLDEKDPLRFVPELLLARAVE